MNKHKVKHIEILTPKAGKQEPQQGTTALELSVWITGGGFNMF